MKRSVCVLIAPLLLQACASAPAVPAAPPVKVAVAVGCLGKASPRPVNNFSKKGPYPGDAIAAKASLVDAAAWEAYALTLEVAQSGCEKKLDTPAP